MRQYLFVSPRGFVNEGYVVAVNDAKAASERLWPTVEAMGGFVHRVTRREARCLLRNGRAAGVNVSVRGVPTIESNIPYVLQGLMADPVVL